MKTKKDPEYYILARKAYIYTWLASTAILIIAILASFQYANYVDRRSNQQWCGLVVLLDESNKDVSPQSEFERQLTGEFVRIRDKFECSR